MIKHQFVVQYGFPQNKDGDVHWEDEGSTQVYGFDPDSTKSVELARNAATHTMLWCEWETNEGETDPDLTLPHRVVHRIISDEAL